MEGFDVDGEGERHFYANGLLPRLRANAGVVVSSISFGEG